MRYGLRMRAALPMADQRRDLPVTAMFLAGSALVALTAGFALGAWLLLSTSAGVPLPAGGWVGLVQVHGQAQLVGFAGLLIMGIGYRVFPRFRGAEPPSTGLVIASFALVAVGLALRSALVWPDSPARSALLVLSGTLGLAGALLFAGIVLDTLSRGDNPHRPDEILIALGALWYPVGATWTLVALVPAVAGAPAGDAAANAAAVATLLLGFIACSVLGVSLRVAPAFSAAPLSSPRVVLGGAALWYAGVVAATLPAGVAPALILAGGLALVYAVGPFRASAASRPLPAPARLTRLAFRAGYAWLLVGLALLTAASLSPWPVAGATTAARHALALGFLMSMVFGVGARLVPALTGGVALPARA
ncbi:MAG: NnrS family protein, partial [Candidatus Limnocylindria bacterium]